MVTTVNIKLILAEFPATKTPKNCELEFPKYDVGIRNNTMCKKKRNLPNDKLSLISNYLTIELICLVLIFSSPVLYACCHPFHTFFLDNISINYI